MSRRLPVHPSVRFLHEEAKDLLRAQRAGDASICATLRLLRRFHDASDADILAAELALAEVQFALAMDYGFESWPALKAHVQAGQTMQIDTKRFILRPFAQADWRDAQELAIDWKAAPGPAFDKWPATDEGCQGLVKHLSRSGGYRAVVDRGSGKVVGLVAMSDHGGGRQEIGHVILSARQDNDQDREVIEAAVRHCFEQGQAASIITHNAPDHAAQIAPLVSLGFVNVNPADRGELELTREQWARGGAAGRAVGQPGVRMVLPDVPKIGFHTGRLCPFPGSVYALLEYTGRPESYDYLMAVSGGAFRRFWNRDDGGNVDLMYLYPEPARLLFWALGLDYRAVPRADRKEMLEAIMASITAGLPVIDFGTVGPPEAGLVCGYDREGEVLLGHSYFDFARHTPEQPYYEKAHWFEQMDPNSPGLILIGRAHDRPSPRSVLAQTLRWAIALARVERRANQPEHVCGLAAGYAWADALEVDADYDTGDESVLRTRAMVHGDQTVMLAERVHAGRFLRAMAEHAPEAADDLRAASDLYDRVHKAHVWPWRVKHFNDAEVKQGLRDGELCREFAHEIREATRAEAAATDLLERALTTMERADRQA
jgi:RimJ/RimL family protein N-acetyltransferase